MKAEVKGIKGRLADRSGLTLLEVIMAMGIFLIGSVGIIALFVTASVLHADASNRRKASFIANELLAEVRSMHFREVFARTKVVNDEWTGAGSDNIIAYAVVADAENQSAWFNVYPLSYLFFPLQKGQIAARWQGAILIEGEDGVAGSEWAWYAWAAWPPPPGQFDILATDRGLWNSNADWATNPPPHSPDQRILQPRTWFYVLDGDITPAASGVLVKGDPANYPDDPLDPANDGAPWQGYIVIDEEWIPYVSRNATTFGFDPTDADGDGIPDARGWGLTRPVVHRAGTPVTVAREHDYYAGFYYTVQFYPLNATGLEAHVVVSVGYGTEKRFRVHTFRSIYTPLQS